MFVAKRSFRDRGVLFSLGDVIDDPKIVPYLRSRIGSGDILILESHTRGLDNWVKYLEDRKGAPLDIRIRALLDPSVLIEEVEDTKAEEVEVEAEETIEVELQIDAPEEVAEVVAEVLAEAVEEVVIQAVLQTEEVKAEKPAAKKAEAKPVKVFGKKPE